MVGLPTPHVTSGFGVRGRGDRCVTAHADPGLDLVFIECFHLWLIKDFLCINFAPLTTLCWEYYLSRSLGFSALKTRHSHLYLAGEDKDGGRGPESVRVLVAEREGVGIFTRASGSRLEGAVSLTCGHHRVLRNVPLFFQVGKEVEEDPQI